MLNFLNPRISGVSMIFFCRKQCGVENTAESKAGIGSQISLSFGRFDTKKTRFSINTDAQLEMELPSILTRVDKFSIHVYPRHVEMVSGKSTIFLKFTDGKHSYIAPKKAVSGKTLEDDMQFKLREELKSLDGSQLIEQAGQVANSKKQRNVPWPWRIQCGRCKKSTMLRYEGDVDCKMKKFKSGKLINFESQRN